MLLKVKNFNLLGKEIIPKEITLELNIIYELINKYQIENQGV